MKTKSFANCNMCLFVSFSLQAHNLRLYHTFKCSQIS